jgi:hypothetical protein
VSLFLAKLSYPEERGRLAVCLQLAGLMAAGLLIAQTSPYLRWSHVPVERLILQSTALTAFAWMAGAAVTFGLYVLCDYLFFQDWGVGEMRHGVIRTAATAVWFVPAIVLASVGHPGALMAALVLVHNVTRLLYWQWQVSVRTEDQPPIEANPLFATSLVRAPLLLQDLAPRLLVSTCLQATAVAVLMHDYRLVRGLFYASTAMITILVMSLRDSGPETGSSIWRSAVGLVLSLLLAGGLTVGSLAPRAWNGTGPADTKNSAGYPAQGPTQTRGIPQPIASAISESFPIDSFPGVILWPEIQPVPTLIAPMPSRRGTVHKTSPLQPMGIPFSGEYWMYRWPYARPPDNSFLNRGNPAAISFRTTDHRPLQMEAHHKLEQAIDLRCCSQIQVAIRNSDYRPGAISLELVLMNTDVRPMLRQSLGVAAVIPVDEQAKSAAGVIETLQFAVPAKGALEEFNEFQVIFIRDPERMDKSAKIAIERFVLMPR